MLSILLLNIVVITIAVVIHYETLYRLSLLVPKLPFHPRFRVLAAVVGTMCAHSVQVWIFAFSYYLVLLKDNLGGFQGNFNGSLLDCAYFSFTTYTTLGYGDIEPLGHLRFLAGLEALTGLVMITWSASFLYIEMQKYWRLH